MKSNIGLIGLAVMGRNLALNIADKGFKISVYNRTTSVTEEMKVKEFHSNINYCLNISDFVNSLEKPAKIIIMVKAGNAVDMVIDELLNYIDKDDIIIDAGNSYFKDTKRRYEYLKTKNINYVGLGVSGGEEGARKGPAMMAGCEKDVYDKVKYILESAAAKYDGETCCRYTSLDGAGHYVKMIHNGIEYGDMELISESYFIMKNILGMENSEISNIFSKWNNHRLQSYLIEITSKILKTKDDLTDNDLVDMIKDISFQKGTGKWTNLEAIELGVDISVISAGLNARYMSMLKNERVLASKILDKKALNSIKILKNDILVDLEKALYLSKIISYAQGFKLLSEAQKVYNWNFDFSDISKIFRAGCIIRARFLSDIQNAYSKDNELSNLMLDEKFSNELNSNIDSLRKIVMLCVDNAMPASAFSYALSYYDTYRSEYLSANMIQAQRDYFGAHTYKRVDREGDFHYNWEF